MKSRFDKTYWENKYLNNKTGWDIGYISTPIKEYTNQLKNKNISILIPGAGNGHEVEYLYHQGFKNITVIDIAEIPLKNLAEKIPDFPKENLINQDFFDHNNTYDLIIEQTFFCALDPHFRSNYVTKMKSLLKKGGKLVGLLFDFELTNEGPPFGGSKDEYLTLFSKLFNIKTLEKSHNSIKPRKEREFFFIFERK
ncbi:MAG: methyltransferase domain-containing protein [Lutibacter sp.]|uniref:methyltransferase domain-containing protein n=1 Tax=Lutibacter sp. TaxID=1925666 RepID=UPI00299D01F4|nr:methyltransferase domain-containing protein [Lutibacter sp.]MDX1828114.1 methyltransferase domain-containing protein [Lutibacter sp.]